MIGRCVHPSSGGRPVGRPIKREFVRSLLRSFKRVCQLAQHSRQLITAFRSAAATDSDFNPRLTDSDFNSRLRAKSTRNRPLLPLVQCHLVAFVPRRGGWTTRRGLRNQTSAFGVGDRSGKTIRHSGFVPSTRQDAYVSARTIKRPFTGSQSSVEHKLARR